MLKPKVSAGGWIYTSAQAQPQPAGVTISSTSYSQMPQQITHPIDRNQNHTLCLLLKPIYPDGFFSCDDCGKQGDGFSYHCGKCNIDLHPICSTMPLTLTTHHHDLNLTFSPPYHNKIFSCDVCKNMGSKEWPYRCNDMCDFDAQMVCATATCTGTATKAIRLPPIQQQQATSRYNYHGIGFLHNNGVQSIHLNSNANNPSPSSAGHGRASSDQQVLRFLANAAIPGLGLLMHGRRMSGVGFEFDSLRNWNWWRRWRCKFVFF